MTTYADFFVALLPAPLAGPWGLRYARTLGGFLDGVLSRAQDAVESHTVTFALDDALPALGGNYALGQLPRETAARYRARFGAAWSTWALAGTAEALTSTLALLGLTGTTLRITRDWPSGPPDHRTDLWSRWWLYIAQPHPWGRPSTLGSHHRLGGPLLLGDGRHLGDGRALGARRTLGSNATRDEVRLVLRALRQWNSARDIGRVEVILAGRILGIGGHHLGDGGRLGAHHVEWRV